MDELIRWTDAGPVTRSYDIRFDVGRGNTRFTVRVWTKHYTEEGLVPDGRSGVGEGATLNFAAVKALIAYDASEAAS